MEHWTRFSVLCLCLYLTILMTGWETAVASTSYDSSPSLNNSIEGTINQSLLFPAGNEIQQEYLGVGNIIWQFNGTDWINVNVSSYLYDFKGQKVGINLALLDSNGGTTTWETFNPFSRVTAKRIVRVPSPQSNSSEPWLLLQATSNGGSRDYFGSTTYVQRLYTIAGSAPATPGYTDEVYESSYSALYVYAAPSV